MGFLAEALTDDGELCTLAVALIKRRQQLLPGLSKAERRAMHYFIFRTVYDLAIHQNAIRRAGVPDFEAFCEHVASDPRSDAYLHVEALPVVENSYEFVGGSEEPS